MGTLDREHELKIVIFWSIISSHHSIPIHDNGKKSCSYLITHQLKNQFMEIFITLVMDIIDTFRSLLIEKKIKLQLNITLLVMSTLEINTVRFDQPFNLPTEFVPNFTRKNQIIFNQGPRSISSSSLLMSSFYQSIHVNIK